MAAALTPLGRRGLAEEMLLHIDMALASQLETVAGEQAVVRILRLRAQGRQRYVIGLPMLLVGSVLAGTCAARLRRWPAAARVPAVEHRALAGEPGPPLAAVR